MYNWYTRSHPKPDLQTSLCYMSRLKAESPYIMQTMYDLLTYTIYLLY